MADSHDGVLLKVYQSDLDDSGCFIVPDGIHTIGPKACLNLSTLKKLVLTDQVTQINNSACANCYNLREVSNGVGLTTIGQYAFSECTQLRSTVLENSCVKTIGNGAFWGCAQFSDVDLSAVQHIGTRAFSRCENLSTVTGLSKVPHRGLRLFQDCSQLEAAQDRTASQSAKKLSI